MRESYRTWLAQVITRRAKVECQQGATQLERGQKMVIYDDCFLEVCGLGCRVKRAKIKDILQSYRSLIQETKLSSVPENTVKEI